MAYRLAPWSVSPGPQPRPACSWLVKTSVPPPFLSPLSDGKDWVPFQVSLSVRKPECLHLQDHERGRECAVLGGVCVAFHGKRVRVRPCVRSQRVPLGTLLSAARGVWLRHRQEFRESRGKVSTLELPQGSWGKQRWRERLGRRRPAYCHLTSQLHLADSLADGHWWMPLSAGQLTYAMAS